MSSEFFNHQELAEIVSEFHADWQAENNFDGSEDLDILPRAIHTLHGPYAKLLRKIIPRLRRCFEDSVGAFVIVFPPGQSKYKIRWIDWADSSLESAELVYTKLSNRVSGSIHDSPIAELATSLSYGRVEQLEVNIRDPLVESLSAVEPEIVTFSLIPCFCRGRVACAVVIARSELDTAADPRSDIAQQIQLMFGSTLGPIIDIDHDRLLEISLAPVIKFSRNPLATAASSTKSLLKQKSEFRASAIGELRKIQESVHQVRVTLWSLDPTGQFGKLKNPEPITKIEKIQEICLKIARNIESQYSAPLVSFLRRSIEFDLQSHFSISPELTQIILTELIMNSYYASFIENPSVKNFLRKAGDSGSEEEAWKLMVSEGVAPRIQVKTRSRGNPENTNSLYVSNNGPEIDPITAARAFEYGFSTRPGGSGIGLSIVKNQSRIAGGNTYIKNIDTEGFTVLTRVKVPMLSRRV